MSKVTQAFTAKQKIEGTKSEISVHSEGKQEDLSSSERFFSFNQTFAGIEQNDKLIQEKATSLNRIRSLQEEVKSCKSRSSLWQKARMEIINLNKYLKLSSISLGCSDSAIMKEFFETLDGILGEKEGQSRDDKSKIAENKKKQAELFEKLVESNKKRYELEQRVVQYEHQISKLSDFNESLREKSRAFSTDRSQKMRQSEEETLMTIHQKDSQISSMEERNNELKLSLVRYQEQIESLKDQLQMKDRDLNIIKQANQELVQVQEQLRTQIRELQGDQQQTQNTILKIRRELDDIVSLNIRLREELKEKTQELIRVKQLVENVRTVNEEFIQEFRIKVRQDESKQKQKIDDLIKKQEQLKKRMEQSATITFKKMKTRTVLKGRHHISKNILPESQELLI